MGKLLQRGQLLLRDGLNIVLWVENNCTVHHWFPLNSVLSLPFFFIKIVTNITGVFGITIIIFCYNY